MCEPSQCFTLRRLWWRVIAYAGARSLIRCHSRNTRRFLCFALSHYDSCYTFLSFNCFSSFFLDSEWSWHDGNIKFLASIRVRTQTFRNSIFNYDVLRAHSHTLAHTHKVVSSEYVVTSIYFYYCIIWQHEMQLRMTLESIWLGRDRAVAAECYYRNHIGR